MRKLDSFKKTGYGTYMVKPQDLGAFVQAARRQGLEVGMEGRANADSVIEMKLKERGPGPGPGTRARSGTRTCTLVCVCLVVCVLALLCVNALLP